MNMNFLQKGFAALAVCLVITACSHDMDFVEEQQTKVEEFNENFKAYVMGGQEVNPNQNWSTAVSTPISISVDLDFDAEYNVYIYQAAPLVNKQTAFIGQATVKSGETKAITIARPADAAYLYAACYDKDMHAIVKPFIVKAKGTEVVFSNKTAATARDITRGTTTGHRWSVTPRNMPDLDRYTLEPLYEMKEAYNSNGAGLEFNQADSSERHLKITGEYSGSIVRLQSYANQSVYVSGTWTVPEDQRCTGESVIIVGDGGKIVIPEGHMLSTNANNAEGTTGMIYVLPGGTIEGAGTLQFSNGTQTYSYNAGTIKVKNININGGTLYNAGTIGIDGETDATKLPYLTGPAGIDPAPSKLINLGHCTLDRMDGAGIALENACNMKVINDLCLGKTSKMDDGSYIECGDLELNGSNNGGVILYMGNSAYMNCLGNFAVLNFGVWGPNESTSATTRALFKINSCTNTNLNGRAGCNYTDRFPSTFMLDNVELIIPENFPTGPDYAYNGNATNLNYGLGYIDQNASTYRAKLLFHGWFNGYGCRLTKGDCYDFQMVHDWGFDENGQWYPAEYAPVWKENETLTIFGDDSRATCIYGSSPSYTVTVDDSENCGTTINKGRDIDPTEPDPVIPEVPATTNWVYYAFEDLGGSKDFDFNDVVIRVSTPVNNVSKVYILAAGGELNSVVTLNGEEFGSEVHEAIGAAAHTITNTKSATVSTSSFKLLGEVTLTSGQTPATLPFGLKVLNSDGTTRSVISSRINNNMSTDKSRYSQVPLYLVVNGDANGKWFWPRELTNITTAFKNFTTWGATLNEGTTWYMPANATDGKVVSW